MKCINLKAPAFKAKMKKYKASAGNLEFHIQKWQLDTGQVWDTDTDATVEAYLDNVYKLSSQNIFDNYKQYQTAKELWDKVNDYLMFQTEQEALDVYEEMVDAFGAEHVIKYLDDTNHFIVKIAEPLYDNKSATDNIGTFSRENDNIYYQKSLAEELQKLRTYNRPIGQAGSAKKQKEAMRKTGADPVLINLVLSLLEKNPSLGVLTPVEILQTTSKAQNQDIAADYYKYIQQPINRALEEHLIQYLAKYGIEVKEDSPLLKKHGVTGAYDIINKIIHIAKEGDRNALTLTEEFAHAFVELMGVVPNTTGRGINKKITPDVNSPHNYDISYLMEEVVKTKIYDQVYEQYKDTYVTKDGNPDVEKIKKEAVGQALAVAIQNNWVAKTETEQTFWDKLKAWFQSIINYFKDAEYINFETLLNKIADEIINNDTSRLQRVDSKNYQLLKYTDTIVNQNKKDNGKALSFMRYFTGLGNIITGSLSYRLQGEVYRGALDSLHDIDMIVPQSAHGIDLTSDEITELRHTIWDRHQSGVKEHTELFKQFKYFDKILKQYPKLKLGSMFPSSDKSYYTINGVYSENPQLSERFLLLTGSYSDRLNQFTEEERSQIYLFDFFLKPNDNDVLGAVQDSQYGLTLAPYATSIKEKQFNMGRAKDIFDYQMWRTYDEFKEQYIPTIETLMFQKKQPKVELYQGKWTRQEVEAQKDKVFLFGDNTNDRLQTHYIPKTTQAVIRDLPNAIGIDTKRNRGLENGWARFAANSYEVSSKGDKRFSALYATFAVGTVLFGHDVSGRTIESVYQHGIKQGDWVTNNNSKTGAPKSKEIIKGTTEDASYYEGYLPLWQEWAKQNPKLIQELKRNVGTKTLTDRFASSRVSQARALSDIIGNSSYFTDADFDQFKTQVDKAIERAINSGKTIVIPADGIGTGKAQLQTKAPKLFNYLQQQLNKLQSSQSTVKINNDTDPQQQTSNAIDEVMVQNSEIVKRSDNFETDHTYLVKQPNGTWKAADSSVTELYGKSTIDKDWGLVSSVIGTEIDNAVRTYFQDDVESYKDFEQYAKRHLPNLYKQGDDTLRHLWRNLVSLHTYILNEYGENCRIITDEFPLVANYTLNDKSGVVVGTMDMLVIDEEGNLHILDMKTTRSSQSFSKNTTKYQNQLTNYGLMLEASHHQLKGKVKSKHLIRFDVNYPNPKETSIELVDGKLIDTTTKETIPITVSLHTQNDKITDDTLVPIANLKEGHKVVIESYNQLSKEEQELIDETVGDVKQQIEQPHQQSERSKQWDALNNTKLLTQSQIQFAANTAMNLVSYLVNELQKGTDWVSELFGIPVTNTAQGGVMGASREYILNHPEKLTSLSKILDMVKELYFCPSEDMPDGIERQRLQLLYDNFDVLKEKGNNKLILLEDYTVTLQKDNVTKEGVDEQLAEDLDSKIEENQLERWQIGERQISAKSSLSVEIRRMFENLPILDENGEQVVDDILGLPLFVDSHTAVNYILEWCKDCETIEEMEEILTAKNESGDFNWTSSILEAIKSEPFRSKFFTNFRKDWTQYSIILMETDFETGKKKAVLHIINSNDAVTTMMKDIKAMYTGGLMSHIIKVVDENLDGRGKVNMTFVNNSKKIIDELIHKVKTTNKYGLTQSDITKLVNLLKEFGVVVQEDILKKAISQDSKQRMSQNTVRMKILNNLNQIVTSMENNKDNMYYSPLLDNLKQEGIPEIGSNVYSNYKNIVSLFSQHLPNTIESSAYQNGKMYYSFVTPSAMGSIIRNLKDALHNENKFDNYIQKYFGQYTFFNKDGKWLCPWLDEIVNGKGKDLLDHKVQLAYNNIDYTELSELDYTVSLLNEYFADQSNSKSKYAWYRVPILSNKPSSEFIKFKRYTGLRTQYQKELTQGFQKIFNQELLRMKTVLEAAALGKEAPIKNFDISKKQREKHKALFDKIKTNLHENSYGITFDDLVKDGKLIFEESGASFKFLEIFNQEIINKTEVGKYILSVLNNEPTRSEELKRTFATEFGRILTDSFNTMLDNAMKQWEQLGLFEIALDKNKQPYLKHLSRLSLSNTASLIKKLQAKDPSLKDPKNIEKLNEKIVETLKEEARPQLEEWLWNDTFATINIIEITATDLAYYKNVEDFQKRYAQLHSPTNKLNTSATFTQNGREIRYSADGLSRTMYIADNTVVSDMVASVETIFDRKIEEAKRNGNKEQAKQLERLKSVIIDGKDGFKHINVADAQGYSSPTSYRKKLGMMGQWTDEMERAYEEIRNGNWNIENFNVVWQPLKPFVYTKVHKNTDGLTLETMPVPSQHKNSEYLLLIADAIISSDREIAKTNKLKGIFDFMEESAYDDNGQYNGIGIDTIQFESAIKSGLSGVIDINHATTAEEVKTILQQHAQARKDVDEIYNENYVHTFEFSDYGIQQPVPAHLQGQQLMGSQIRILSVSDIQNPNALIDLSDKNGNQMTIGQARDEYMALVAENIRESYNDLIKELKLKGTRKQQNKALAQLLREAILKDQRFGGDLLFACELNKDGEFNIPLNDPIQSVRIQQLLNSIIKSRINKQKIAGGPVVQTSMYGLDQDLSIRFKTKNNKLLDTYKEWCKKHNKKMNEASAKAYKKYVSDEQGSLAYYECLLPIPDSEMQKALTKTDGSLMSVEEALNAGIISEECLEAIGYRIPTEDKYSMYPMKIVGFLPSSEEIIMLPKEITLITGSDKYHCFYQYNIKNHINCWKL